MKEERLKKCPFCRGNSKLEMNCYGQMFNPNYWTPNYWVECTKCYARTRYFKTRKSAIINWNKRECE